MAALPEPVKDLFHELVELVGDVFGEALLGLAAIGLGCLAWWGFQRAPYLTASVVAGILVFAGYGVAAVIRLHRELPVGRLGVAAMVTAGVAALLVVSL